MHVDEVKDIPTVTLDDLEWADAIILSLSIPSINIRIIILPYAVIRNISSGSGTLFMANPGGFL